MLGRRVCTLCAIFVLAVLLVAGCQDIGTRPYTNAVITGPWARKRSEAMQSQELNIESLESLRESGILLVGEHLAMNVDMKIDAGLELTADECGILWLGITQGQAAFVRQHELVGLESGACFGACSTWNPLHSSATSCKDEC